MKPLCYSMYHICMIKMYLYVLHMTMLWLRINLLTIFKITRVEISTGRLNIKRIKEAFNL